MQQPSNAAALESRSYSCADPKKPGLGLIVVFLVAFVVIGCPDTPAPTWEAFTVTAKPLGEVGVYGAVVPIEFTVKNGHDVPVFVERIEATAGRRWELMAFSRRETIHIEESESGFVAWTGDKFPPNAKKRRVLLHYGLLMPGQELTFVLPYRLIAAEDKLILTITPTSSADLPGKVYLPITYPEWRLADGEGLFAFGKRSQGALDPASPSRDRAVLRMKPVPQPEPILAGAVVRLSAPVAPFDPKWTRNVRDRPEAWAFSPRLGGYIVRVRAGSYNLQLENEVIPLPPTPFEFFEAIDGPEGGTKLLRHSGDVDTVTKDNVREILGEVLRSGRQVSFSDDRERAPFQERPW